MTTVVEHFNAYKYYLEWASIEEYDQALKEAGYTQGVTTVLTDANMANLAAVLIAVGQRNSRGG